MSRALSRLFVVVAVLAALTFLTGCGADETSGGSTTIDITVKDGKVQPAGSKVEVEAGQPVRLRIDSDAADELHVHSSPEQEIAFDAGTSEKTITIDQPGVVDIEIHDLDKLVVQLEVR